MTGDLRRICVVLSGGSSCRACSGRRSCSAWFPSRLAIEFTGPGAGPVASSQGGQVTAAIGYDAAATPGIMLIPRRSGHETTRHRRGLPVLAARLGDARVCRDLGVHGVHGPWRRQACSTATGRPRTRPPSRGCVSRAGGRLIAQARWVQDRDRWTSSGVAARMDMAAALLADLFGTDVHKGPRHEPGLRYTKMRRGTHSPRFPVSPKSSAPRAHSDDATAQCCLARCRVASRVRRVHPALPWVSRVV